MIEDTGLTLCVNPMAIGGLQMNIWDTGWIWHETPLKQNKNRNYDPQTINTSNRRK